MRRDPVTARGHRPCDVGVKALGRIDERRRAKPGEIQGGRHDGHADGDAPDHERGYPESDTVVMLPTAAPTSGHPDDRVGRQALQECFDSRLEIVTIA